jgi:hypothetical protein
MSGAAILLADSSVVMGRGSSTRDFFLAEISSACGDDDSDNGTAILCCGGSRSVRFTAFRRTVTVRFRFGPFLITGSVGMGASPWSLDGLASADGGEVSILTKGSSLTSCVLVDGLTSGTSAVSVLMTGSSLMPCILIKRRRVGSSRMIIRLCICHGIRIYWNHRRRRHRHRHQQEEETSQHQVKLCW